MKKYILPLVAMVAVVGVGPASGIAASSSGNFKITVTIGKTCTVGATDVNFGPLATVTGTETANSTVTVNCNANTPYDLSFANTKGTLVKSGNLSNGANQIGYDMSLGTALAAAGSGSGTHIITVGLQAAAFPPDGTYQDTATVFVVY